MNSNPGQLGGIESNQLVITPIPNQAQVIAISITNVLMTFGGFRAAMSDGSVVSDSSWKCSLALATAGWQSIDFDDTSWPAATTTGWSSVCSQFPPTAKFLWTDRFYSSMIAAVTICCRKSLSKLYVLICVAASISRADISNVT